MLGRRATGIEPSLAIRAAEIGDEIVGRHEVGTEAGPKWRSPPVPHSDAFCRRRVVLKHIVGVVDEAFEYDREDQ